MRIRPRSLCLALLLLGVATIAGSQTVSGSINNATVTPQGDPGTESQSPRNMCVARCESDNGKCNSDVRRGRQDCSKTAANGGNNPFTGRPDQYDYYCGYFTLVDHCTAYGSYRGQCAQRYSQRYGECVEWMRGNVAARRFDCFRAESKAQSLCRTELQDCKKQCEQ